MVFVRNNPNQKPDSEGRLSWTAFWYESNGVFRPELSSADDGKPVGYRRAQCFFTSKEWLLERHPSALFFPSEYDARKAIATEWRIV